MKYTYKVVSLESFLQQEKDLKIFSTDYYEASGLVAKAVEFLLNHYAEDGWQYVGAQDFDGDYFKTAGAAFFEGLLGKYSGSVGGGPRPVFIFRKELSIEEQARKSVEQEVRVQEARSQAAAKGDLKEEIAAVADAQCPNCDSLIMSSDHECWKCKANFEPGSNWRPKRL